MILIRGINCRIVYPTSLSLVGLLLLDIAGILPLGSGFHLHHYSNCLERVHSFEGHLEEPGIFSGFTCFLVIRAWQDFIE